MRAQLKLALARMRVAQRKGGLQDCPVYRRPNRHYRIHQSGLRAEPSSRP